MATTKHSVIVEVCTAAAKADWAELGAITQLYIRVQASRRLAEGHRPPFSPGALLPLTHAPAMLTSAISSLRVCDVSFPLDCTWTTLDDVTFCTRLYHLCEEDGAGAARLHGQPQMTVPLTADGDDGDAPAFTVTQLPNASLEGLWESLYYGEGEAASIYFKRDVVSYVDTAMRFSRAGVNPHFISWNRLVLFHGPPGTGKTSLCRALAQKLSIRLSNSGFPRACLLDINAHSLFSRWFSESGKQVLHLFERIHSIAADTDCLVCCVMDEVESLAAARVSAMKGNEPSDSIRVVNALLTQIDRLQRRENILVLATSNLTGAIDEALLDRADKRIYVGPPGLHARQVMLQTGVQELLEKELVSLPHESEESRTQIFVDVELRDGSVSGAIVEAEEAASASASRRSDYQRSSNEAAESPELQDEEAPPAVPVRKASENGSVHKLQPAVKAPSHSGAHGSNSSGVKSSPGNGSEQRSPPRYKLTTLLRHVAEASEGLNGRTLKKLPFLAYGTRVCKSAGHTGAVAELSAVPLAAFMEALFDAARQAAAQVSVDHKVGQ